MNDRSNLVVDPGALFGGSGEPDLSIPSFLSRNTAPVAPEEHAAQVSNEAASEHFPVEQTDAGEQHTIVGSHVDPNAGDRPEHTPPGHNEPPPEPLSREEMLRDFNKDVAAYGRDSGKGASALPRLGLRVIRAAADGLISTEKPKDGTKSDAVRIYEKYAENDSKHAEHTKGGMKANAAKLNALIGLGSMTTVDGVEVASRAVAIRERMEANELKPKALFAGLVDVARKQMAQDTALDDNAIEEALGKAPKEKTVEEEWQGIYKKIENLVTGEGSQGLRDDSDEAMAIAKMVDEHIKNFGVKKENEDKIAFCMERGMTREQATNFVIAK